MGSDGRATLKNDMRDQHSFRSVLLNNEYKALKGSCYSTVWYLLFIFFITFLAFGFAQSTLNYQQKISSDPYSNWINLNYQYYQSASITPVAYVSPNGSSTAAYALFGKATTLNTVPNQLTMLEGGFLMNVYTTGNVAVDTGFHSNVLVAGGAIRPAI